MNEEDRRYYGLSTPDKSLRPRRRERFTMKLTTPNFVGLNVGGVVYRTRLSTLTRYTDSMLGAMFTSPITSERDEHGNYLIDGDSQMFRYILNYLRRDGLYLPDDFQEFDLLREEADFYQIPGLRSAITAHQLPLKKSDTEKQSHASQHDTVNNVIEIHICEKDGFSQQWRIYGKHRFLEECPSLAPYVQDYRKAAQSLQMSIQHPMFQSSTNGKKFPRTTLFYQICSLGFKLHTTDNITITDTEGEDVPWLRYVFISNE